MWRSPSNSSARRLARSIRLPNPMLYELSNSIAMALGAGRAKAAFCMSFKNGRAKIMARTAQAAIRSNRRSRRRNFCCRTTAFCDIFRNLNVLKTWSRARCRLMRCKSNGTRAPRAPYKNKGVRKVKPMGDEYSENIRKGHHHFQ